MNGPSLGSRKSFSEGAVTIKPKGLLPAEEYVVTCHESPLSQKRRGDGQKYAAEPGQAVQSDGLPDVLGEQMSRAKSVDFKAQRP